MAIRATVGGGCEEPILEVLREWERLGVSPVAGAAWLKSLRLAVSRTSAPDFVWTGPEVAGLHARDTRRVYEELLGIAERSIWASTYAFFDGPQAFKMLASRMDAVPGLEVTLLLNIERRRGDTTDADTLVRRFADEFWGREWPDMARRNKAPPTVWYGPAPAMLRMRHCAASSNAHHLHRLKVAAPHTHTRPSTPCPTPSPRTPKSSSPRPAIWCAGSSSAS